MKNQKIFGFFSILLLLVILPFASASDVFLDATWVVDGEALDGQNSLTVKLGATVNFAVLINSLNGYEAFNVYLVDSQNQIIENPGWDINFQNFGGGTEMYSFSYVTEEVDTFNILTVVDTASGESSDQLTLVVYCDDADKDGVCDNKDICAGSDDNLDTDGDGVPNGCDVCPEGNDNLDSDGDGVPDECDNCPSNANANQADSDGDGIGNVCDIEEEENVSPIIVLPDAKEHYENKKISYTIAVDDQNDDDLVVGAYTGESVGQVIADFLICIFSLGQVCEFGDSVNLEELGATFVDNEDGTWTFTWTPSYDFVEHPDTEDSLIILFTADDGEEAVLQEVTFNVNDVNRVPTLGSFNVPEEVFVDEEFMVSAEADDADDDQLSYEWAIYHSNGEDFTTFFGKEITLSYDTSGTYLISLTIEDGFGGQLIESQEIAVIENPVCDPNTVDNGMVSDFPDCAITCNEGFAFDSETSTCVEEIVVPEVCDPNTIDNGGVSDFPDCTITCNEGFAFDEETSTCGIVVPEVCDVSAVGNGVVSEYPECAVTCNVGNTFDEGTSTCNLIVCDDGFHLEGDLCIVDPVYGCTDDEALNYNSLAVVDNGDCEYPILKQGLYFKKVHLVQEVVPVGGYLQTSLTVVNNGDLDLENLKVSITIPELGLKKSSSVFDLEFAEQKNVGLYLPISYVPQGTYLLKVTVGNDQFHESTYRQIIVA